MTTIFVKDFSVFPGPRTKELGENSGEAFRDDILIPAIREHKQVRVNLDGVFGYGSSFLEEVFGGLVRAGVSTESVQFIRDNLVSQDDPSIIVEIREYIANALQGKK
ncbi:STAS-like domain-containing protein [Aeromonas salmonicida]|uniref:STAS-like domain-containing protein n=1 Tax=Aeromonas salmonicida TaxID=645 RepID=UPI003D24D5DF